MRNLRQTNPATKAILKFENHGKKMHKVAIGVYLILRKVQQVMGRYC